LWVARKAAWKVAIQVDAMADSWAVCLVAATADEKAAWRVDRKAVLRALQLVDEKALMWVWLVQKKA
jgi:hypothetical protein